MKTFDRRRTGGKTTAASKRDHALQTGVNCSISLLSSKKNYRGVDPENMHSTIGCRISLISNIPEAPASVVFARFASLDAKLEDRFKVSRKDPVHVAKHLEHICRDLEPAPRNPLGDEAGIGPVSNRSRSPVASRAAYNRFVCVLELSACPLAVSRNVFKASMV